MRLSDHDEWARAHHGLLTLDAAGVSRRAWRQAVRSGALVSVHRDVARLPGAPTTFVQRIAAAVLAGGDGTVCSHHSAAYLWELVDAPSPVVHVIVPAGKGRLPLDNVGTHRPRDRRDLAPVERSGVACTPITRTLCDLGASDPDLVEHAVRRAVRLGLVELDTLRRVADAHSVQGRTGIPALRRAIDAAERRLQTLKRNSITSPSWAT